MPRGGARLSHGADIFADHQHRPDWRTVHLLLIGSSSVRAVAARNPGHTVGQVGAVLPIVQCTVVFINACVVEEEAFVVGDKACV